MRRLVSALHSVLSRLIASPIKARNAWPLVLTDLQFFIDNGKGKKMYFDEVSRASSNLANTL